MEALAGIHTPTFYLVGDKDDTVGYETGVRALYNSAYNSERYLLTFINAGHNAGAPMPLPWEMLESPSGKGADHYIDSVWDNVRMNNVMAHFATAHFSLYLKADASMRRYLDIRPDDVQTNVATGEKQEQKVPEPWPGFTEDSAVGLMLEKLRRGEKG